MKKFANEFKVGMFVVVCLAGLLYLTFSTGKVNVKKEGYVIYVTFNEIAGLEKKAPVMLNGFEVGKVEDISIVYDDERTQTVLKLWLDKSAKIRENPVIAIKTLGLMGEKYIQISSYEGKGFMQPDSVVAGKPYLDLDALLEQAQVLSKEITVQVNKLVGNLNSTLDDNKSGIANIVGNFEATSKNFEEFSADIKRNPWKVLIKTKEVKDDKDKPGKNAEKSK